MIGQFWQELKRRKVLPIFVAYLATFLAAIEFLNITSQRLAISGSTSTLLSIRVTDGLPDK